MALTQLTDKAGNGIGYVMDIPDADVPQTTIFLTDLGYVRTVSGTDLARYAYNEYFEDIETVDVYHYDLFSFSQAYDFIMRLIDNDQYDIGVIHAFLMEHTVDGDGDRFAFAKHRCADPKVCETCIRIDKEIEEDYDRICAEETES